MAYERTRVLMGLDINDRPVYKQISGRSQDQRNDNIVRAYIESGRIRDFLPEMCSPAPSAPACSHPFSEYAQEWYGRFKSHLRETTAITQRGWLKELCRFFKATPIERIGVSQVQDYLNAIQRNTTGTIGQKLTFLGEILNSACEDGLLEKNPAMSSRIQLGGKKSEGIEALSTETIKKLIARIRNVEDCQIQFYLALMLYTGLRREEMLGLCWEDVDFCGKLLHVERAVTYPSSKPVVGPTKTPKSKRTLPMPDELIAVLGPHRQDRGYLLADENVALYNDYQVKQLRNAARIYSGLPRLDARELRHSYASMLHAAGVEVRAIGACLGHTKSDTTDRYIQVETSRLIDVRNAGINYVIGT